MNQDTPINRNSTPATILVVDDSSIALYLLESILTTKGYKVVTASNGVEAMAVLEKEAEQIDTILLDRMMPEMDGMEVTRRVLANPELKYIPIVMLTSADRPEEVSEGIKAGVFYYLTKPIEGKTVLSIVSASVKEMQQRKALRVEMRKHRLSFGLIDVIKTTCSTLNEAESLSSFLANCFPDPERALTGISELLFNAIEHGNLGITYDDKTELMNNNRWRDEVERRQLLPEYSEKKVTIVFEKKDDACYLQITDQGKGFEWKRFLQVDLSRASHNHGKGVAMANIIAFDNLQYNEVGNQVTAAMQQQATNPNFS